MNLHRLFPVFVFATLPFAAVQAQSPDASPTPAGSAPATGAITSTTSAGTTASPSHAQHTDRRAMLTPEERTKLKAAHKAAMEDPSVKALESTKDSDKRGYRQAVRAAMLKADPSVGPILEKMREEHPNRRNQ